MREPGEKANFSDSELVALSLAGDRDAFAGIVSRYQTLLCSMAYSATGSVSQSEDLAQETFLAAWRRLADLREPKKLRSWLCGIARNLTCETLRRSQREPIQKASPLDEIQESPAVEPLPSDWTISREEEAILWRLIERIPESYRQPLVLFYREHQSVENVAAALDLTRDTVKQRLSRGRKLVHSHVLAFLEGALERTSPGKAFTIGVIAALPAFAISSKAQEIGAATAKGGITAKVVAAGGWSSTILAPLLGFAGSYFGYRIGMAAARSDDERDYIKRFYSRLLASLLGFWVGYGVLLLYAQHFIADRHLIFSSWVIGLVAPSAFALFATGIFWLRAPRRFRAELAARGVPPVEARPAWEYRSKMVLFGLPLIHVRGNGGLVSRIVPVKAWIASGDFAIGLLFASGNLAIAPVSIGSSAIGLLSFGGCAIGLITLGGLSVGLWSFGALALGWKSFGACAIAWHAANGGIALAHHFAFGGVATALQANNPAAVDYFQNEPFFRHPARLLFYLGWLNLLWVAPVFARWRLMANDRSPRNQGPPPKNNVRGINQNPIPRNI
jgi:RNA polymerase sigma factor (sigma-70 family)